MKYDVRSTVWFIPNILDYFRITILIVVLFSYDQFPQVSTLLFTLGALLDAVDGALSRALRQESKLGQILDMTVDRSYLAVICIIFIKIYPQFWSWISLILVIDMMSHFGLLYGCYLLQRQESHLEFLYQCIGCKQNTIGFLFKLFTKKSWFRFASCLGHDLFLGIFVVHHNFPWVPLEPIVFLASPFFAMKIVINIIQWLVIIKMMSEA